MMVEGQVLGGVVHGIGATLLEWMQYDDSGQPLTGTFADYLLPTSDVVPRIEIHHMELPTPLNPLGVKGAAESGTIGAPSRHRLRHRGCARSAWASGSPTCRVTPARLRRAIRAAQAKTRRRQP